MDTNKITDKTKKFLAELVEDSLMWPSTDLQYQIAEELKEILGEFTPTEILETIVSKNEDWVLDTYSINPNTNEEKIIFTNIVDSTIQKEDKKIDGLLVESSIKEIPTKVLTPVVFPKIEGGKLITEEDEW